MPEYKSTRLQKYYFKFNSKLIFNSDSNNLFNVDLKARFYVEPGSLIDALYWDERPSRIDKGYFKDPDSGLYLKNMLDVDDLEIEGRYDRIKNSPPFSYRNQQEYGEYARQIFNEAQQTKYQEQYVDLRMQGKEVTPLQGNPYVPLVVEYFSQQSATVYKDALYNPWVTVKGLPSIV